MSHARRRDLVQSLRLVICRRPRRLYSPAEQDQRRWQQWAAVRGWQLALGVVMLASLDGCGAAIGRVIGQQFVSARYAFEVRLPGEAWQIVTGDPSVLTLSHSQLTAGMTIDVTCQREHNASLDILARHLLFGFRDRQVLLQETHTLQGVPALKTVTSARLDSREFLVSSYILQHHGCVYDMVYFASPQDFAQSEADFERLVAQFRFLN